MPIVTRGSREIERGSAVAREAQPAQNGPMAGGGSNGAFELRVLGAVAASRDGAVVALGGPRQRTLLALLAVHAGRPLSVERLADELWHGTPPAGAATTLRSYVSRLRATLRDDAPIRASSGTYLLEIPPDQVDACRFERLAEDGHEALAQGAVGRAAERLRAALELWGAPFDGLADGGALRLEADRLEEVRLHALEARIQADLALGAANELVDELEALVREQPFRERLWRHLMLALYQSGRQADALAAYRRARALLAEEIGIEPGEELRQLEQAILRQEVPLVLPPEERHNLPAPLSSFVGRESELGELGGLLEEARLVTLTGVGGAGKTRLALEAAARALPGSPDGVYFVDLSGLAEPMHVTGHVAGVFELREQSDMSFGERLTARLRDAELLLVLDNCEHLREACAELARTLLVACPGLRILATSRELLGVPGETDFPVPPLTLPAAGADPAELRASEAVRLFLARAREARPRLTDDEQALESAARICRDLDGLPLALELAAARAKVLSLEEIAGRLADRFRFLVSWRRLTTARHRTLEQAMNWSYELLDDEQQALLARLSVFAGGFTLAAAASVCVEGDDARAVELVGRLVDASLVVAEERDGEMRYRLLETVRQYGAARLEAREETGAVRRLHAEWCLAIAEEAEPELTGEKQVRWFAILEAEHDNLRAGLTHLAETGEADLRLRLTIALTRFRYVRGYLSEARGQLRQALEVGGEHVSAHRRRALTAAAALALLQGDYPEATALAEESLEVARASGDPKFVANALSNLGAIVLAAGDHTRAGALLEEAVALAREVGDERIAALAINHLGDVALTVGDYERAAPLFEESLALLRTRGDTSNVSRALFNLGAVALQLGRLDEADERFRESVAHGRTAGDKEDLAWCLEGLAGLAAARSEGERAALLLGAAGALLREMGADYKPFERQLHDATEGRALALCGAEPFAEATQQGAALTLDGALEVALDRP